MADRIAEVQPDAVVIQHQDGLLPWSELAELLSDVRLSQTVTVVTLHNAAQLPLRTEAERAVVVTGLRRAARVVVHTLEDLNLLVGLGLADNVSFLPHGASAPNTRPMIRDLTQSARGPLIGCHGFFLPGKGVDRLIKACAELRRTWPNLRLRLVNARFPAQVSDDEIQACQKLADKLGFSDAIEWFTEFRSMEEITELLGGCDLIVIPYDERTDSASGSVRVAISSLAPVVVTRVAIFAELGDAVGWLDSNAPQVIVKTLDDLLRDGRRRQAIRSAAMDWLEEHDWSTVAARLEGMVESLVEARRASPLSQVISVTSEASEIVAPAAGAQADPSVARRSA